MNILILVHPDCLSEQYVYMPEQAEEYLEKLEQHLPKFDHVFVLRMERVTEEWIASVNTEIQQHFAKLKAILERHADLQIFDNDLARTSLNKEIGEFLLEYPNSTLYLSGGYQDNCLRLVADNLVYELGDFIKELGIRVKVYTPLVYYYKKGIGFKELRRPLPWWDKDWIEQYQEDQKKKREERSFRDWADEAPIGREYSRGDWWEGPTEKLAFLNKRLSMLVGRLRSPLKKHKKKASFKQKASKLLYYHGTHTGVLDSILQQGLVPSPPERAYGSETGGLESYRGIYLTESPFFAIQSGCMMTPEDEKPVVFEVLLETEAETISIDEDDLLSFIPTAKQLKESQSDSEEALAMIMQNLQRTGLVQEKLNLLQPLFRALLENPERERELFPQIQDLLRGELENLPNSAGRRLHRLVSLTEIPPSSIRGYAVFDGKEVLFEGNLSPRFIKEAQRWIRLTDDDWDVLSEINMDQWDHIELPSDKIASLKKVLAKRLRLLVGRLKKQAIKEYFDQQEILEILSDGIPDLKIEKMPGDKREFAGTTELVIPFAYGEIPNYINPADDMGWDVIVVPSAVKLPKEKLAPIGVLKYKQDVDFWDTFPGDDPIGNDKILLGEKDNSLEGVYRGIYTKEDLEILNQFVEKIEVFEDLNLKGKLR